MFDIDGSGAIGTDELSDAMKSMGMNATQRELEQLIREVCFRRKTTESHFPMIENKQKTTESRVPAIENKQKTTHCSWMPTVMVKLTLTSSVIA